MRTVNEKLIQIKNVVNSYFSDDKKAEFLSAILDEPKNSAPVKTEPARGSNLSIFEPIKRAGRPTINALTIAFLKTGARTESETLEYILTIYPERNDNFVRPDGSVKIGKKFDALRRSNKRRLNNYLRKEKFQNVIRTVSNNGSVRYQIKDEPNEPARSDTIIVP